VAEDKRPAGAIKKIQAAAPLKQLMTDYFVELDRASTTGDAKVAWCTSVGPAELLRAFGFRVYFPENHAALIGTSRLAADLIPAANAAGYAPSICSYLTSDIGAYLRKTTPLTRAFGLAAVPRPDLLVYNTNQCRDVQDWLAFYQREFQVPLIGIETPRAVVEVTDAHVKSLTSQYHALVPTLKQVSGQAFDFDRLKEVVTSSWRCTLLWKRVLRMAAHVPSPLTFFDATIHMAPAVVLRGDERAERYYEVLLAELGERLRDGVGAVDQEELRFYWEGMPIWGKLREMAELFAGLRAAVVASTYCNSWIFEALGAPDPFEAMARAYTELFIVRAESYKERYLASMVRNFGVNAIVYHDAMTCPNNSNNRYGMPMRLERDLGIPYVVVSGDLNDLRLYSEEQTRTQIEALVEQLTSRPEGRNLQ
jgi:benzoyl-CoA reductase/2-hydroxyglutaryl-CoA dehydratase subunit BcrC/BadD/HgdB